jgi:hypothetical protein
MTRSPPQRPGRPSVSRPFRYPRGGESFKAQRTRADIHSVAARASASRLLSCFLVSAVLVVTPASAGAANSAQEAVHAVFLSFQLDIRSHHFESACSVATANFQEQVTAWANANDATDHHRYGTCASAVPAIWKGTAEAPAQLKRGVAKLAVHVTGTVATMLKGSIGMIRVQGHWLLAKFAYIGSD